jgi:superfamily II DNA or RNA helicase
MKINESKLARQLIGVGNVIANFILGLGATLEWCTGMGKTFAAFLIINKMLARDKNRTTIVIVPTELLKGQWEFKAKKEGIKNIKVYVINGITMNNIKLECSLLILDEAHGFASEVFSRIFELVDYEFLLMLTATIIRLDGKHDMLLEKAPIVDSIPLQEAKKNGWVSDYMEYNLGIDLIEEDRNEYDKINKEFHKYFSYFGHDFKLAMNCTGSKKTKHLAEKYAKENDLDIKKVIFNGIMFSRYMKFRKTFLYKAMAKHLIALDIIDNFPFKTVTFSESTEFADRLTKAINDKHGEISVSYHSKVKTILVDGKKQGKTVRNREALKRFADNRYKVRIINTAKALDEGFDVEDVVLALVTSSTSNPKQHIQRVGRAIRDFINKHGNRKIALIINVYIKKSQDEKWLKSRQTDPKTKKPINPNVIWIDNIKEISYGNLNVESTNLSATC